MGWYNITSCGLAWVVALGLIGSGVLVVWLVVWCSWVLWWVFGAV